MSDKNYIALALQNHLTIRHIDPARIRTELLSDLFVISLTHLPKDTPGLSFEEVQILDCVYNTIGLFGVQFTQQLILYDTISNHIDEIQIQLKLPAYQLVNQGLAKFFNAGPTP